MRALLLALLLAGCVLPRAPTQADSMTVEKDGWTVTFRWPDATAALGEVRALDVSVRHAMPAPKAFLEPTSRWMSVGDGPSRWVEIPNGSVDAQVRFVVGAIDRVALRVWLHDGSASTVIEGPDVHADAEPVSARDESDATGWPTGLHAQRDGARVVAWYAAPAASTTCSTIVSHDRDFALQRSGDAPLLVGYVVRTTSDACAPIPQPATRVVAQTPPLQGEVVVKMVYADECFCVPDGWKTEETRA